jgi:hypothetical protein
MFRSTFIAILIMALIMPGLAQTARMDLLLIDSSSKNPDEFVFRVTLTTDSANLYWIQDTGYLKANVSESAQNLIYLHLSKLDDATYKMYGHRKHHGDYLPNNCLTDCCNCTYLGHSQSIHFNLNLLRCCDFEPGTYRLSVYTEPPLNSTVSSTLKGIRGIESNDIYFRIEK